MTVGDVSDLPARLQGRPVATLGYVWVGDVDAGRAYLPTFRQVGEPAAERAVEMSYVELQSIADENHRHGKRRYMKGHYLTGLSDGAIDAYLSRGVGGDGAPDWSRVPNGGFQAYGGAIAEVSDQGSAFSQRGAVIEFGAGSSWLDPAEDEARMSASRAYAAAMEPYASGIYVNAITDEGEAGVRRAYPSEKYARLSTIKGRYDPDNVFHLNQNIRPAAT
jgi:hypothetical protein